MLPVRRVLTDAMWAELLAVIAMANETNRLAAGWACRSILRFRRLEGRARSSSNCEGWHAA